MLAIAVGVVLATAGVAVVTAPPAAAEPSCAAFTQRVYDQLHATTYAQSLTTTAAGSVTAQTQGFTTYRSNSVSAAAGPGTSLQPVHKLVRSTTGNVFYSLDPAEIARAVGELGYRDAGVAFHAATEAAACTVPVRSYYLPRRGLHRFTSSAAEGQTLVAGGWRQERVRFHLGRPTGATFTVAIIPDTQTEVTTSSDTRFANRTSWLSAHKNVLGIGFATHTGDVVNWDISDHVQYRRARSALGRLNGRIPYSITVGNHDTAAVEVGGTPIESGTRLRNTTTANAYLNQGTAALAGRFQSGRMDNTFHTFTAAGRSWLVLNLEPWPRGEVVAWADRVVKAHPQHNVLVATHAFLTSDGPVSTSAEYGSTSPQHLYDTVLRTNPNVKIVVSGHTGAATHRELAGASGGRIQGFLTTMHDRSTNPVRLIEINVAAGTVASFVYSPASKKTYPAYVVNARPAGWVG